MTPLRAQLIRAMPLQRLAPKTQEAYGAAVAGLATFYQCAPDQLRPAQSRTYLPHLLVERPLAWSSCNQVAAGLQFFYPKTLGWDMLQLNLPPRTGRSQLPHVLSPEELQRLFSSAQPPKHRPLLMTTYAAGLQVSAVVHLQLTAIESDRRLMRVKQGKGHKARYPLRSPRLLAELRAYWKLARPPRWLLPGQDLTKPMPKGTAQRIYSHAKRAANIPHGKGIHTLRHSFAPPLLESGVAPRTLQLLRGPRSLDTTSRYLQVTRPPLAGIRSPCDLLRIDPLPPTAVESDHGPDTKPLPPSGRGARGWGPAVGGRGHLPPVWRGVLGHPSGVVVGAKGHA
jgi:integrase/recombinase XerD